MIQNSIVLFILILFIKAVSLNAGSIEEVISIDIKKKLIIGYSGAPVSYDYWYKLKKSLFLKGKELDVIVVDFSSDILTYEAQKKIYCMLLI